MKPPAEPATVLPARRWPLGWPRPRGGGWTFFLALAVPGALLVIYVLTRLMVRAGDGTLDAAFSLHGDDSIDLAGLFAVMGLGLGCWKHPPRHDRGLRLAVTRPRQRSVAGRVEQVVGRETGWRFRGSLSRALGPGLICLVLAVGLATVSPEESTPWLWWLGGGFLALVGFAAILAAPMQRVVLTPEHVVVEGVIGSVAVPWTQISAVRPGEEQRGNNLKHRPLLLDVGSRDQLRARPSGFRSQAAGSLVPLPVSAPAGDPILLHDVLVHFRAHPDQRLQLTQPPQVHRTP